MNRQIKAMSITLTLLVSSICVVFYNKYHASNQPVKRYSPPSVSIAAEPATLEQWQNLIKSVGTINAVRGVNITSQVGGLIKEVFIESGHSIKKGQLLVQLDDSVEQANLRSYDAQLQLAQINYERDKKLLAGRAISKTDFDTIEARLKDAQAQVERTKALIEQKRILAPFSGHLGIRQFTIGDYVDVGDQLVTLQALDYLYVDFNVPEQYFPKLHTGQRVYFTVQAFSEQEFDATVSAINVLVDQKTRSILVRASLKNQNQQLLPGMFANVSIVLSQGTPLVTVPQTAIDYSLHGDSIFLVEQKGQNEQGEPIQRVQRRYVKVAQRYKERIAIVEGLNEGEIVVIAGQLKLSDGTQVRIDNSVTL